MNGGRIDGGTITTTGGAALAAARQLPTTPPPQPNGTLDGVTLNGTLDMSADGAYVAVVDGLTLNTDLYLSGYDAELQFNDGSTVAAGPLVQNATIHLSGPYAVLYNDTSANAVLNNDPSQTVTFGRNVTISGENYTSGIFGPFDNLGTIEQNTAGQFMVDELVNDGSVAGQPGRHRHLDSLAAVSETPTASSSLPASPGATMPTARSRRPGGDAEPATNGPTTAPSRWMPPPP